MPTGEGALNESNSLLTKVRGLALDSANSGVNDASALAANQAERYPNAAALAIDLRRHLTDLPLLGVRNRSWRELWRKWRRRRPVGLPLVVLSVFLVGAAVAGFGYVRDRISSAEAALKQQKMMRLNSASPANTSATVLTAMPAARSGGKA